MSEHFITAADVTRHVFPGMGTLGAISEPTGSEAVLFGDLAFEPGEGFNFHHHPHQDEALYVIDGSIEAWIGDEKRQLSPGDTMWLPAQTVHACFNRAQTTAKMFVILTPVVPDAELAFELVDVSGEAPWKDLV